MATNVMKFVRVSSSCVLRLRFPPKTPFGKRASLSLCMTSKRSSSLSRLERTLPSSKSARSEPVPKRLRGGGEPERLGFVSAGQREREEDATGHSALAPEPLHQRLQHDAGPALPAGAVGSQQPNQTQGHAQGG